MSNAQFQNLFVRINYTLKLLVSSLQNSKTVQVETLTFLAVSPCKTNVRKTTIKNLSVFSSDNV